MKTIVNYVLHTLTNNLLNLNLDVFSFGIVFKCGNKLASFEPLTHGYYFYYN